MPEKIIIPIEADLGLDSIPAHHFGRAPYFLFIEIDANGQVIAQKTIANTGEHFGGHGHAHDFILDYKPNYIIVYSMGPRGLISFQEAGVKVLRCPEAKVSEIMRQFTEGKLEPLELGCTPHERCHYEKHK